MTSINIHRVETLTLSKTRTNKVGQREFYTRDLIATDGDGVKVELTLYAHEKNNLEILKP